MLSWPLTAASGARRYCSTITPFGGIASVTLIRCDCVGADYFEKKDQYICSTVLHEFGNSGATSSGHLRNEALFTAIDLALSLSLSVSRWLMDPRIQSLFTGLIFLPLPKAVRPVFGGAASSTFRLPPHAIDGDRFLARRPAGPHFDMR